MMPRELPSSAVTGLSVFGSDRCETTNLPPRLTASAAGRHCHPEAAANVPSTAAVIHHSACGLRTLTLLVAKVSSDSGSSLLERLWSRGLYRISSGLRARENRIYSTTRDCNRQETQVSRRSPVATSSSAAPEHCTAED